LASETELADRGHTAYRQLERAQWLLPALCAWIFYISLSHEAYRRILALDTVENYGFAVFNQLLYNFSHHGAFFQTIHRGYDNSWMWSGHKAAILPLVGKLYGLRPSPFTLAQIQIGLVSLGAFPAYAFGRLTIGGCLGGLTGLGLYFAYPPLYFIALNDYQDLILAVPFLMMALYMSRRGSLVGFIITAFIACLTREEVALMMTLVGFGVPGGIKRRMLFGLSGAAVGLLYLTGVYLLFHDQMTYEATAQTQLKALLTWPPNLPELMYDKAEAARYYLGFLKPVHWLAFGSPITLLPGLGALAMHALVNPGNGVDRVWNAHSHIHHLAVVMPLIIAASLETLGWIVIRLRGRSSLPRWVSSLVPVGVITVAIVLTAPVLRDGLKLRLAISPAVQSWPISPVWTLVAQVPAEAVIATDKHASLAISVRRESYTYDESLEEKLRHQDPLKHLDYILVRLSDQQWLRRAQAFPGAAVVGEAGGYRLIKLK